MSMSEKGLCLNFDGTGGFVASWPVKLLLSKGYITHGTVRDPSAGGFVALWLVELLLSKDYMVHGTVKYPSDEKNAHLNKLEKASEILQLIMADLLDYSGLCAAIAGCSVVFHVACPFPPGNVPNPEARLFCSRTDWACCNGNTQCTKACSEAKVKRVVVVSSIAAVMLNPNWPKDQVIDEECWSNKEVCKVAEIFLLHINSRNGIVFQKAEVESDAFEYARTTQLDVVNECETLENKIPIIVLDVQDAAEVLLLTYEKPEAQGRYICVSYIRKTQDAVDKLKSINPNYNYPKNGALPNTEWRIRKGYHNGEGVVELKKQVLKMVERVCVTGAGGYLASWLVKVLLSSGYMVHGTVRDPGDEKNAHLNKFENALENLQLFKADLLDYNGICAAIAGCSGVFHVASPVPPGSVELIEPAVTGTRNVLMACSEAKVKRIVVVSSIAAVVMNPNWPKDQVMDEECWSKKEYCREKENWYSLSKTEAESEAFQYAKTSGLDVVTVCPSIVIGPMLQSSMNASSLFLLTLLKDGYKDLENKDRALVDVRDVAKALLLTYETPEAEGRYICTSYIIRTQDVIDKLKSMYPNYNYSKNLTEVDEDLKLSSEKLQKLGWKFRPLEESFVDSVRNYQENGILDKQQPT
ncbi:hypothetical protein HHK36_008841 [Tetracentron sinense]|uniref:Cinnamoyl-CoA reductase n=1 Tax=Tetracentron sinense TaxID=13715 RepID=A0A834ZG66_TETSI|nr:hypothetical protein HHK36_008841 [Tetracentron sinense]